MNTTSSTIIVGVKDARQKAALEVAASASALASRLQRPLCLVHVITPDETNAAGAETRLERIDERLLESRRQLWRLGRALTGAGSVRLRVTIDVLVADSPHEGLCEAAHRHAAASIFVGPGVGTVAALTEMAPCDVMVARRKTTPDQALPIIDPPLEPGEHVRTTDARSEVHIVRPGWTNRHYRDVTNAIGVSRW